MATILHKGIEGLLKMLKAGLHGTKPIFLELPSDTGLHQFLSAKKSSAPDAVVIGPGVHNPVPILQEAHAEDKTLSIVIIAESTEYTSIKNRVQFAPFIGTNVKVVENKAITLVLDEISEAIKRTQQRRKYSRLNFESRKIEPELVIPGTVRQQYMDKFLELAPVGAVLLDTELSVVTMNRQASVFFAPASNGTGKIFTDLFPAELKSGIIEFLNSEKNSNGSLLKTVSIPKGDRRMFLDLVVSKDFRLDVQGYSIVILLDVTDRIAWEEALSQHEERLRLAIEAGEMGTWDYDPVSGNLEWDNRCRELFDIPYDVRMTYEIFEKRLHPDDRELVGFEMQKALEGMNNGVLDIQYRTAGVNNETLRWIRAKGRALFNEDHVAVRFLGIVIDITEAVRSREMLEETIAQKNEFFSIASHELKTPLTSLKAYMQLVNEKISQAGEASTLNYVKKVIEQVDKLNLLVSELLDLSKLEAGKLKFDMAPFNFDEMVKEAVSIMQPSLSTHKIIIEGEAGTPVVGDKQRLEQVLINYLTNAIKYSPGKEVVKVRITRKGENVVLAVSDEGIGISKEKVKRIFERFYRVEGIVHRFQGFGIGLYIASEIVKRHKGKVWLESEEEKGSTFYFSIPVQ